MKTHKRPVRTLWAALAAAMLTSLPPSGAQAALLARDLTGDNVTDAYYDTVLNVSWYAVANSFFANVNDARQWVDSLVVGSATQWRLPHLLPVNGSTYNFQTSNNGSTDFGTAAPGSGWGTASEMGHLFYVTLLNQGYWIADPLNPNSNNVNPQWNPQAQNTGGLNWVAGDAPYFADEVSPGTSYPWTFSFRSGFQYVMNEGTVGYALAVHDGDVGSFVAAGGGAAAVPEPGTLLLAAAALGGLCLRRRA